jgi:hypothetical protein
MLSASHVSYVASLVKAPFDSGWGAPRKGR